MSEVIRLDAIKRDGGTQTRIGLNLETVNEYAEALRDGAVFPDIVVFYDGADYWLADGFHRYEAHKEAGATQINCDLRQGTRRDAVLYSVGANATHGLRRTNADKRRAVETLLRDEEWAKWSDREIARRAGVSDRFVNGIRKEMPSANGSQIERTVERNGTTYTQNTSNIGKATQPAQRKLELGYVVSVGNDVGVIVGVNNPHYPGRAAVKRDNLVGFMTHWIHETTIICPCNQSEKVIKATRVWQWHDTLRRLYANSLSLRSQGGWQMRGGLNGDDALVQTLLEAGLIEQRGEKYRIAEKGCEWLGRPDIDYPDADQETRSEWLAQSDDDEDEQPDDQQPAAGKFAEGDRVITRTGHEGIVTQVTTSKHVMVTTANGTRPHDPATLKLADQQPVEVIEIPVQIEQPTIEELRVSAFERWHYTSNALKSIFERANDAPGVALEWVEMLREWLDEAEAELQKREALPQ